jgi:hypothetical protein
LPASSSSLLPFFFIVKHQHHSPHHSPHRAHPPPSTRGPLTYLNVIIMDEQRRLAIYNGIKANRTKTQQPKVRKETMFFLVARGLCEYYADPRAGKVSHRWLMNKILREFSKNLWGHYSMSDDEIITETEMDALNDDDIANLPVLNEYMRTHRMTMDQ